MEHLGLLDAGSNRVYAAVATRLGAAEVDHLARWALAEPVDAAAVEVAGVPYTSISRASPLSADDLAVLANTSGLAALFERVGPDLLRPVPLTRRAVLPTDLTTIQRYPGRTNEAFTHLLVNLALAAAADGWGRLLGGTRLCLLDPLCGRGTTLNRAALYGMDAIGCERVRGDVEAYEQFFVRWLKDHRVKHQVARATHRKGREQAARRVDVSYRLPAPAAGGDAERVVEVVADDTAEVAGHFGRRSADLLVADLPYGVAHRGRRADGDAQRSPEDLLRHALPAWADVLKGTGSAVLAWNRRTLERDRLVDLVGEVGWRVLEAPGGSDALVHDVDRSIRRDVLVAVPTRR